MRVHLTLVTMPIIKKAKITNAVDSRESRALVHCWWECKLAQPFWSVVWKIPKKPKNITT
jgi:hypothetical protein